MDSAPQRGTFQGPKARACRGVGGIPLENFEIWASSCISCILEHALGYVNRTLMSLNFGFFFVQRGFMNTLFFLEMQLMARHFGFEEMLIKNRVT